MKLLGRTVGYHLTEGPNAGQCRPAIVLRVQSKDDALVLDLVVFEMPEDSPPVEVFSDTSAPVPEHLQVMASCVAMTAVGQAFVGAASQGTDPGQWMLLEDSAPVEPVAKVGSAVVLKSGGPEMTVTESFYAPPGELDSIPGIGPSHRYRLRAVGFVETEDGVEKLEVVAHPDAFLVVEGVRVAISEEPSQTEKNRKNLS